MPYFRKGERVKIAPHTNAFMMGERYGEMISDSGRKWNRIRGERSGKILRFARDGDGLETTEPRVTFNPDYETGNGERGIYSIRDMTHGGFTCLAPYVLERRLTGYLDWLALEVTDESTADAAADLRRNPAPRGTVERYAQYEEALRLAGAYARRTGRRCPAELTPALIGLEGHRVEVRTPDGESRRFIVGKSTGWSPIHLEIANRASHGGMAAYIPDGARVIDLGAVR